MNGPVSSDLMSEIDLIEKLAATFKIRYSSLEAYLDRFKEYNSVSTKYVIGLNITPLLDFLSGKTPDGNKRVMFHKKVEHIHIALAVLNVIAHYRHFYHSRFNSKNLVLVYTSSFYKNAAYRKVLDVLDSFATYIPNLLVVKTILDSETITMPHIINGIYRMILVKSKSANISLHLYSNSSMEEQIVVASKDNQMIKNTPYGIYSKTPLEIFKTRVGKAYDIIESCPFYSEVAALYAPIRYMFDKTYTGTLHEFEEAEALEAESSKRSVYYRYRKPTDRIAGLTDFIKKNITCDRTTLIKRFCLQYFDQQYYDTVLREIKKLSFDFVPEVYEVVKPLITSWSAKVKDRALSNIDEKAKLLSKHQIRIDWLMEA